MNKPRKPKKVKAPDGCESYLTEGKEYRIFNVDDTSFDIVADYGEIANCLFKGCSHIAEQDWIVTEYED